MATVVTGFLAAGLPLVLIVSLGLVLARREPSETTRH